MTSVLIGVGDLLRQPLLVFGGNARRIFFGRLKKWVGVDDALALHGKLFDQKSDRHQLVLHAGAKNFGGLAEHARDLMQSGDVVLVVLDRVERNGERQIGKAGVDAILLVDRHLVLFEIVVGDALLQHAHQKIVGELVLIGETSSGNGLQPGKKVLVGLVVLRRWRRVNARRACRCSGSRRRR